MFDLHSRLTPRAVAKQCGFPSFGRFLGDSDAVYGPNIPRPPQVDERPAPPRSSNTNTIGIECNISGPNLRRRCLPHSWYHLLSGRRKWVPFVHFRRRAALTASQSSVSLNGLNRHSTAPCLRRRRRAAASPLAVMKTIGIPASRRFSSC